MACIASTFTGSVAALKASKVTVRVLLAARLARRTRRAPYPARAVVFIFATLHLLIAPSSPSEAFGI